jgi:branched-chain amino acid aminotransferase
MHRLVLHNGALRDAGDLLLSTGQVGVLTGWGVFSTIRVYEGVPFAWERHWARMVHDAAIVRVPFPADAEALRADLVRLIEANQAWNATMRVSVLRNRGGMFEGPGIERDFDVIGFTREVRAWAPDVRLGVAANARHAASEFSGVKVLSWAQNLTLYERAIEQGFDEVLLLNERGEVCECTSANIFAVHGGVVRTPPLSSGCLPGVTRALLLEEVRAAGLEVRESTLFPADLESADEVIVTSTTRELLPVVSIAGLKLAAKGSAACDRLRAALAEYVRDYIAPRVPVKS